jgi:hypothetical protein
VSGSTGKPPILKVRKDAEQEVRFHYNREERVALHRPIRREKQLGGFFARLLRGGRKSLLPVLLGVLAIVLAVRLLPRDRATGHLAGYDVSLRAYAYQDALLASVIVSWKPGAKDEASEAADAMVRFSTSETAAGSVSIEPLGGGEAVVRGRLPYTGAERRIVAEVAIGGKALRLVAGVGKPAVGKP